MFQSVGPTGPVVSILDGDRDGSHVNYTLVGRLVLVVSETPLKE